MVKRGVSKAQWLESALEVLRGEGIEAVKIGRLAEKLGIARSGFYWHFKDRSDLLDHLRDYWAHEYTEIVTRDPDTLSGSPTDRLLRLVQMVEEYDLAGLDLSMRAWAEQDPATRDCWRKVNGLRLEFVGSIFAEAGFKGEELELRTRMFVCYTSWKNTVFGAPAPEMVAAEHSRQVKILTAT